MDRSIEPKKMRDLKYYLNKAQKEGWAIGQFNFSTLEQLRGIMRAAQKMKSPIILGTSEGESKFLGIKEAVALTEILKTEYNVPAFLNLDHGKDFDYIEKCIKYGYSAVHFDGSSFSLEKNLKYAKKIVQKAHKNNVLVEGEMDGIGECLTDPATAEEFTKKTNIDSLAIAIGSKHGFYKNIKIDFERLKEIRSKTDAFLVLHGGSGIPAKDIKKAVKCGIVKINVNTELRMAWKEGIKKGILTKEIKPYGIIPAAEDKVQRKVEEKIKIFNSFNKIK
jgi:ketose-bisphosphate aldolase